VDSVCIGLTSSNRVTFAENFTGPGSACQSTSSGWTTALDPWASPDTSVQMRKRESLQQVGLFRGAVKCIGWTMILVRGS
jgi:hypothetical protein